MTTLTLAQAQTIVTATLAKGREMGLKPICVAVLDRGGHLIVLQREDGASNLRPQIAMAKASGALGRGVSSRTIGEMAAERPTFVASLASLTGAEIIPGAGGLLIKVGDELVGAVGVTGDTSDNDEACAAAGIAAAGL